MDCTTYKDTFVARQPIFDASMSTWGYLLLHRHGPEDSWAAFESAYSSTADVLACLPFLSGCLPPRLQTLLHFPMQSIRENFPAALNPETTTMVIPGRHQPQGKDIHLLKKYRQSGFKLALDASSDALPTPELLDVADVLLCDVQKCSYDHLTELVALGREHGLDLCAKNIATGEQLKQAETFNFNFFHGCFFVQPENLSVRMAPAGALSKLRLFELLAPNEPDFDALSAAIEPDVVITHRLFVFLNSAHFSFTQEISSVRQAVVLAGWDPIRNWLRIILLTDVLPTKKSHELGYRSAHRAKFLELLAMRAERDELADSLFLFGLFSLLDTILDLPMEDILSHLSLSKEISSSLLGEQGPYRVWLDLTQAIEKGKWDQLGDLAMRLDLPPGSVAESYRLAFQWADEFFGMPESSK